MQSDAKLLLAGGMRLFRLFVVEKSKCEFDEWGPGQSRILDVLLCRRVNMDVGTGAMYRVQDRENFSFSFSFCCVKSKYGCEEWDNVQSPGQRKF